MSSRRPPWSVLGLDAGADAGAIRKAYASRLKAIDPDTDPAGFARLREARETALRLARRAGPLADPAPAFIDEAPPAAIWPYAAPDFDAGPASGDAALTVNVSLPGSEAIPAPATIIGQARSEPPAATPIVDPFATAIAPHASAAPLPTIASNPQPEKRLYALLLGNGEGDETTLDDAELAAAQDCLRLVLHDAAQADLTQHDAIEAWVADTLAEAWPRSAQLLATAADSFRWEAEAGKLRERPAIAFLNARRKGYRFQEAVLDRTHIYHKAWVELQRPGRKDLFARFRTNRGDVDKLLTGVRRNFPELENHFDPDRVAAWQAPARFRIGLRKGWWVFVLLSVAVRLAISLSQSDETPLQQLSPQALMTLQQHGRAEAAALMAAFGPGHDLAWLEQRQPELAQVIQSNVRLQTEAGNPDAKIARIASDLVRQRLFEARDTVKGDLFDRIMRLRLAEMKVAQRAGPAECRAFVQTALLDPDKAALPDTLRRREQALSVELAEAGKLTPIDRQAPRSATVSGRLVSEVLDVTHLPIERVRAAMQHKASDADNCAVTTALLQATLAYDGKEREVILRTL